VARVKIGLLGGTFDPPHIGHLILGQLALEQLSLDRVWLIPAGDPWRKVGRSVTDSRHRLAMARLAIADNAAFEVDDCEVTREGATYTVDTLRLLRNRRPGDELYLLLGEDALADIPNWKEPASLPDLVTIAVAPRRGTRVPALPFETSRVMHIDMPGVDLSSTGLRQRALRGESLRYFVPDAVAAYIEANRLYAAS
jgi:nicotinate-nucleotide adenylyltransferase